MASSDQKARPSRRRIKASEYRTLGAFRFALRKFLAFSEAGAKAHGLTTQQHQALLAIFVHVGDEPMTVGELAESLIIKNHSAVGLVERLEKRRLVERAPSSLDRRRVVLTITPEAEAILEVITRANMGELGRTAAAFEELLDLLRASEQAGASRKG